MIRLVRLSQLQSAVAAVLLSCSLIEMAWSLDQKPREAVPLIHFAEATPSLQGRRPARPAAASKTKDPIRIASLDRQSARLEGLMSHAAYQVVAPDQSPDLVWDPSTRDVMTGGEVLAHNVDREDLGVIVDRMAAIRWFKVRAAKSPQDIKIFPDDTLHKKGEQVEIAIQGLTGRSLIVFNIAGDGTIQLLYPLGSDPPVVKSAEQRITVLVREPFGSDQIIAVSAASRQDELEQAMRQLDRQQNPLKVAELVERYDGAGVWVGLTGLSSAP